VLEESATKFAFNSSPFITLLLTIFKLGARNVFHWLPDTPHTAQKHSFHKRVYFYPSYSKQKPEMFSNGLQTHLINMFIAHASSPGETEDTIS
jgi:hypothetical protein